ncbi:MAG: GTP-binding protein, partial [Bacteroidales bacterium]|nr:GTP-binding protein [Bacteroidales bacterium]
MQEIRNIALIAHVDHGKTTLVDRMIYQANLVRNPENLGQLILDNNDIERERGITILAKNVSVTYKGVKINIIDTPGHSDFGGEVERVLNMADGVLLLVDAFEGCMPQTRFVLHKALQLGKKPIVVINKVDKPNCRPDEVQEEVFDLMFALDATEEQLDFKTIYGSAKQGWMSEDWRKPAADITPLLDTILEEIPAPKIVEGTPQMQITSLEYSPYVGRIAVGKVTRGSLVSGTQVSLCKRYDVVERHKIKQLMVFDGLGKTNVDAVRCGDICAVVGIDGFEIGDTISDFEHPEALPPISIDEPTMSMLFSINNSPFFGKDGKFVTSRHIKERLDKELEKNLALRVKPGLTADSFIVYGRGILHLSVLIEEMRREGFELQVGQPKVLDKTINGQRCEPVEDLSIEVPEQFVGTAIELATRRKGALLHMEPRGDRTLLTFDIPTRGLMGLRSNLLTASQGEAIMAHRFKEYQPYKGEIESRTNGSLVSLETGTAIAYSM